MQVVSQNFCILTTQEQKHSTFDQELCAKYSICRNTKLLLKAPISQSLSLLITILCHFFLPVK